MCFIMEPIWLKWSKDLQSIAQTGLYYSDNPFDRERYERIQTIAAEIMSEFSNITVEEILDIFSMQAGHTTPKVDVRGVVFKDNKILLVKEISDNGWTLPGGWADPNDSPSDSTIREIREESGFTARPLKVLAVYDRTKQGHTPPHAFHIYKIFIQCEITGGEPKNSIETSGVGFFHEDKLPPLSIARVTKKQIKRFFEHLRNPALPTDFD